MGRRSHIEVRLTWTQMLASDRFAGRWVALDNVRYDPTTSQPIEADVVDVDDELGELCTRMRASDRTSCAVLYCDAATRGRAALGLATPVSSRMVQH
jgi:hypothetical protein